jgi:hypothetical protein
MLPPDSPELSPIFGDGLIGQTAVGCGLSVVQLCGSLQPIAEFHTVSVGHLWQNALSCGNAVAIGRPPTPVRLYRRYLSWQRGHSRRYDVGVVSRSRR